MQEAEEPLRPPKKAKSQQLNGQNATKLLQMPKKSRARRLFAPFRALGIVSNGTPFAVQTRGGKGSTKTAVNVVTSLGRAWAMWDAAASLNLLFVGPETPQDITAVLVEGDSVFAAAGSTIYRYVRGKQVASMSSIEDGFASSSTQATSSAYTITTFISLSPYICGLAADGKRLFIWNSTENELHTTIDFDTTFTATQLVHPSTYINKVVVASEQGSLQIWNIQSRQLIHEFTAESFGFVLGTAPLITCIVQSPAIDVLAIGFSDGQIVIFDIRVGGVLLQFEMTPEQASAGTPARQRGVTSLSFRTDNVAQTLASSDSSGNIALWDLDSGGKLLSLLRRAHNARIGSLRFLPGQPVLLSSGADNAIREWIFDTATSPPRLLKERSGHGSPPSMIRYYGSDGKALLSSSRGDRTLRYTSIVRDSRSFELSQGSIASKSAKLGMAVKELRLSPIEGLSFTGMNSGQGGVGNASIIKREWDDVLTVHADEETARTWSVENKRLGKYRFSLDGYNSGSAKATCVTACGNFGLVGYERGDRVVMWNMQSGIKRREFKLPKSQSKRGRHVTSIQTDALNTVVIVSTLAGALHFFDFHNGKLLSTAALTSSIVSSLLQRENNLLACVCDDLTVRLIDIETKRVVREFVGFKGRIVDIAFSSDARWLVTTSTDSVIRTFDIPTGQLVDVFKTASMATSLTFSPTGDFLATSHVDSVGVYLWTNRAQFAEVSLQTIDEDEHLRAQDVVLPQLQGEEDDDNLLADLQEASGVNDVPVGEDDDDQLSSELVTLTLLPRTKWQTLINLETITARNKPKEPPKAPEQAPFFLPTLPGTETRFDLAGVNGNSQNEGKDQKRKLGFAEMEVESDTIRRLRQSMEEGDLDEFFEKLFALSPSALDLEVRSLASTEQLVLFLRALTQRLRSRRDFEAVQAVLNVFLAIHTDQLSGAADDEATELFGTEGDDDDHKEMLQDALTDMLNAQLQETQKVGSLVRTSLGMVAWARGVPVV